MLAPQAGFAAVLGGRRRTLLCEELTLRARLDVYEGHDRQAALQVLVALDAALAELCLDPAAPLLAERLEELRGRRDAVAGAAQAALAGGSATPTVRWSCSRCRGSRRRCERAQSQPAPN